MCVFNCYYVFIEKKSTVEFIEMNVEDFFKKFYFYIKRRFKCFFKRIPLCLIVKKKNIHYYNIIIKCIFL